MWPSTCRAATSFSAEACRAAYIEGRAVDIPHGLPAMQARCTLVVLLRAALRANGFGVEAYEFNSGIQRVLDTDQAEQRWLAGDNIFAGVAIDPDSLTARAAEVAMIAGQLH